MAVNGDAASHQPFRLVADRKAAEWLDRHPASSPLVIAFDVHRCCGGGKLCEVSVRAMSRKDDPARFATGLLNDGTPLLIDRRAAARLPHRFGLTARGIGRFKHLDLDLEAEQWGTLLYD